MKAGRKQLLSAVAEQVLQHRAELLDALVGVETYRTACTELDWTLTALEAAEHRVAWLDERDPIGTVYASVPATMPVYSFVLFALSPAAVGNRVIARAASASRPCARLVNELAAKAGAAVEMTDAPWEDFAAGACAEADGVVFAGSASHIRAFDERLPADTHFIGQGPGVSAAIVTEDADVELAARTINATRLFNSSQDCLATERVYIADQVYDAFVDSLLAHAETVVLGDNANPGTELGPLLIPDAAPAWYDRLPELGRVLRKGTAPDDRLYDLAIVETTWDSPVVLEETFCPLLPLVRYEGRRELHRCSPPATSRSQRPSSVTRGRPEPPTSPMSPSTSRSITSKTPGHPSDSVMVTSLCSW
ncbi:aldehyde dehydrogenase family protein [Saccharopolyspora sp. NPDC050389]|uniref:aldehyde dehydrogenase family protein n=1 Tax=Saccharopolyspora sp. NPDC050389 TaxID=3155516 RepID=UPI0033EFD3B1